VRFPTPDDPELTAAIRRHVTPGTGIIRRYMRLLNGNFLALGEGKRRRFLKKLARSARQVSDRELAILLESGWREALTASWLIALDRREQFRDRIGELLLASEMGYASQGYCLALARFATLPTPASWPPAWTPTSHNWTTATTRTGLWAPCCTSTRYSAPTRPPGS
jgi:hypothetical protein